MHPIACARKHATSAKHLKIHGRFQARENVLSVLKSAKGRENMQSALSVRIYGHKDKHRKTWHSVSNAGKYAPEAKDRKICTCFQGRENLHRKRSPGKICTRFQAGKIRMRCQERENMNWVPTVAKI